MRSRIVLVVMVIAVVVVAVLLSKMEHRPGGIHSVQKVDEAGAPPSDQKIIGGGVVTFGSSQAVPPGAPAPKPVDAEFQKWIATEAKQVDATHIDGDKKRGELAKVVSMLTADQARQLLQTAQSAASSAGERILAAYLMVEAGPRAEAELQQLIVGPVSNPGPHETHSEDELRAMQERSVRAMAVDGLISRAEKDAQAREALAKTIPSIPDPYIKAYAQKRLDEIKAH